MECIFQLRLVPRAITSDRGTENTIICSIQRFLRRNTEDLISNETSFVYGSSTRNQRIECWWSILRPSGLNWWINIFKFLNIYVCGEYCGYQFFFFFQFNISRRGSLILFHTNLTRRTQ